jgi:uncharacterized protein YaaR (DUF327 family)
MRTFGAILQYQSEAVNAYFEQRMQPEQRLQRAGHDKTGHDGTGQQQFEFILPAEQEEQQAEQLQQHFDNLDAEIKAQLTTRAEQKLAAYKDRMTEDVYTETLKIAMFQEMQEFFQKQGFQ